MIATKQTDKQRSFLHALFRQLATPIIEIRSNNHHMVKYPRIRNAKEAFGVIVPQTSIQDERGYKSPGTYSQHKPKNAN